MKYQVSQHDSPQGLVVAFCYDVKLGLTKAKRLMWASACKGASHIPNIPRIGFI